MELSASDYADRISSLLEARLPLAVEGGGGEDDWSVVGPAMLAAAARHLRALQHLQGGFSSGVVAWQILRSMFEYVTTFAWVAAEPETRTQRWLKCDYEQRLKLNNDLVCLGADPLLDAATRKRLSGYGPNLERMPSFADIALQADEAWRDTLRHLDGYVCEGRAALQAAVRMDLPQRQQVYTPDLSWGERLCERHPTGVDRRDERPHERNLAVIGTAVLALGLAVASTAVPALGMAVDEVVEALS